MPMTQPAPRLLILDDDPAVARTMAVIARQQGFEVHDFDAPRPFLEAIGRLGPTHVALDLIMPEMDGVEVLRQLACNGCTASLILTSGMGARVLEAAQATARERGLHVVGVLPKPFLPRHLRELLAMRHERSAARPLPVSEDALSSRAATRLAAAIDVGALTIVAQPKLELASRRIIGAEILCRWHDPELGPIAPDLFVPMAEQQGLMQQLTKLVVRDALAWFATSPLRAWGSMAVNLSTSCLRDVRLADHIQAACERAGVAPEQLILEITESTAMDRTADCFDTLTRLRLKGFRLSVDDFGTGYSSLAQLARLPLSEIKIDRSFVGRLLSSDDARKIVDATCRLAEGMGLISVAEGVESAALLEALESLGCRMAQGFHISPPLECAAFDRMLARQRPPVDGREDSGPANREACA